MDKNLMAILSRGVANWCTLKGGGVIKGGSITHGASGPICDYRPSADLLNPLIENKKKYMWHQQTFYKYILLRRRNSTYENLENLENL